MENRKTVERPFPKIHWMRCRHGLVCNPVTVWLLFKIRRWLQRVPVVQKSQLGRAAERRLRTRVQFPVISHNHMKTRDKYALSLPRLGS